MALGSIAGAIAGGVASAGASAAASNLLGGDESPTRGLTPRRAGLNRLERFRPVNINAGGIRTSLDDRTLSLETSPERQGLVRSLAETFPEQAGEIAGLRERVAPGMSELREARLQQVENARQRSVGNLRENLQRRRVLGSSFGADALARAESEFAQQADEVAAESFLQEIDLTNQLINQQFEAQRGEFQTGLDELNLQADVAANLASSATSNMRAAASTEAQLRSQLARERAGLLAQEQQGTGQFIGQALQPSLDQLSTSVSGLFEGGGGGTSGVPLPTRNPLR